MKKFTVILLIQLIFRTVFAQDSTQVTYTQELDTLVNQRFIDRYENVFLTKVPTRHMLRLGFTSIPGSFAKSDTPFTNTFDAGYEYKLFPAISVGVNFTMDDLLPIERNSTTTFSAGAKIRWYYDLQRRISEGKSANNFNGNFLSIVSDNFIRTEEPNAQRLSRVGLEFGLLRRLYGGYVELGIGAYFQRYNGDYFPGFEGPSQQKLSDIAISTRVSFGSAFYDWKRTGKAPTCDIIFCDEIVTHQFKILWPDISLSKNTTVASSQVSFEQKINKSPLSINAQLFASYADYRANGAANASGDNLSAVKRYQIQPSLQMRYYLFQKRQIKKGTGGNNLSGLYFGPYSDYINYSFESAGWKSNYEHLGLGITAGFQRTLLRNFYTEFYFAESWNLLRKQPDISSAKGSIRLGFGFVL